jgi:hypothetical protein
MSRQPRFLDCAAVLHADPATGELVDGWGGRICQASSRVHVPDLCLLEVDRPVAGTRPPMADQPMKVGPGRTGADCPTSRPLRLRLRVARDRPKDGP